jgi:hypothetical protein
MIKTIAVIAVVLLAGVLIFAAMKPDIFRVQRSTSIKAPAETTITQTVLYPSKEARDRALGTGMKSGISVSFDRLADHLRMKGR